MNLQTRIAATVAVVAGVASSMFAVTPANAAEGDCANYPGTVCMAENNDWSGRIWRQYPDQVSGCRPLSRDSFNNKATALANSTSGQVIMFLYDNADCTGTRIAVESGEVRFLRNDPFNDKASAIRVVQA